MGKGGGGQKLSAYMSKMYVYTIEITIYRERTCGLHYKPMTIINDDARVINKLEASLADDAKVVNYNHHMFKV